MDTALHSAVSGLHAAAKRLEVSAGNVTNARSESFVPGRVVQTAQEPAGTRAEVMAVERPVYPPEPPAAGLEGTAAQPEVAPAAETAAQIIARREFEANLRSLEAVDRMQKSLLD